MLNVKKIQILSYALLFLSFLLFSVGWLKPLTALLTVVLVLLLFCRLIKSELADEEFVTVSKREFITIIVVALLITWLGGIGGYFPQSEDQYMRNAIYRDLILENYLKVSFFYTNVLEQKLIIEDDTSYKIVIN